MISVAVCDDSIIECSRIAGKIKELLDETGVPCFVRQFNSGKELLQAQESFDIVFLDILMDGLDGMKTAELFRGGCSECERNRQRSAPERHIKAADAGNGQFRREPLR